MTDSYKVGHSRCPECAKKGRDTHGDNFVEYSDGHSHCFACGYRHYNHVKQRLTQREGLVPHKDLSKRHNQYIFSTDIPSVYRRWLNRYKITPELIEKYGIKYNETTHGLCFELPGRGQVERYVNEVKGEEVSKNRLSRLHRPKKWILRRKRVGNAASNAWGPSGERRFVVLVEDAVSGIRVVEAAKLQSKDQAARGYVCSYPLLGTNINGNDLYSLCRAFYGVGVWLDRDKRDHALKLAARASQWNARVVVIGSDADPKVYSEESIRNFLLQLVSK